MILVCFRHGRGFEQTMQSRDKDEVKHSNGEAPLPAVFGRPHLLTARCWSLIGNPPQQATGRRASRAGE
jgi:hypothetical protein